MRRTISAFILDLDGVITDTAEYHFQAWKRLADEEGIAFTREDNEQLRGVSRRRSLELLLGDRLSDYDQVEIRRMMARKNGYYQALLQLIDEGNFLPGARELMSEIRSRGLKMAIGSASKNTRTVLTNLGIVDIFDVIADGHSVEHGKPAPDLFLFAAEQMGVEPVACAVIEDAASGIEAALAARMVAIGVGPPERVGCAHFIYRTTADIDLKAILKGR